MVFCMADAVCERNIQPKQNRTCKLIMFSNRMRNLSTIHVHHSLIINRVWMSINTFLHYCIDFAEGSVYRTGTGPQLNCLKEPGKAHDAISMQRE